MIERFNNLHKLIGNTPMVKITYNYKGKENFVFFKLESYSLSGSIKDRMALSVLEEGYKNGEITKNTEIVEVTSGNTGIAFACLGTYLKNKVTIFMPSKMSKERQDLIKGYGANLVLVDGGFEKALKMADIYVEGKDVYMPKQFENKYNKQSYKKAMIPEILDRLNSVNLKPNVFVAGVGTGGTIMAAAESFENCKIIAVEPESSPTLKTGSKIGSHKIEGISDEFIPPLLDLSKVDNIMDVNDNDSIIMTRKLASELGLAVGISSGANFLACVKVQNSQNINGAVVSVFADSNKKYLSTDLFKDIENNNSYISNNIELKGYEVL